MSENFRGVTFAEQSVTPADDAIVRRAILPDGILTGCEISYSGSTLTMAAGYIIACGRMFQHIAAQNWAVVDATSGFARLVLTIDLTKTATEDTFNQIESSIEYAAAEDGFVDLEQSDINLSGTRYQIAAAVVSLGTGGITGIVSQLALSRVEGGGGLNFSVVDGLTQPGDPKENMIWVYTEGMTGWQFAAEQPEEMAEGEVWISTGTASQVAFNALKKGTIMVYPLAAKQMQEDGTLVDVTAKSWIDGEWVDWAQKLLILKDGTLHVGEWSVGSGSSQFSNGTINATMNSNSGNAGYLSEKIDTSKHKKLVFRANVSAVLSNGYVFNFGLASQPPTEYGYDNQIKKMVSFVPITAPNGGYTEYELNLGDLPAGEYYLAVVAIATYAIDYIEFM